MKNIEKRICIYPKDIQLITGKSYRQSARLLQKIRSDFNKLENELVSIDEFCQYTSLKIEQVEPLIIGWGNKKNIINKISKNSLDKFNNQFIDWTKNQAFTLINYFIFIYLCYKISKNLQVIIEEQKRDPRILKDIKINNIN